MAAACDATPECDFFVFYPLGRALGAAPATQPSGVLKTARSSNNASQLNTTEGDLLEPQGYDQRTFFNTLSASYFKCAPRACWLPTWVSSGTVRGWVLARAPKREQ